MRIAAVILAGGKGERLGGANKALLEIGGRSFIDRAVAVAGGCEPILIAVGRRGFEVPPATTAIWDLEGDYAGPLAGVAAAVEHLGHAKANALFSLAVDTPLFPADFLSRALPLLGEADVVIGAYGAQDYPTNALWRLDAIAALADEVRSEAAPRSLKRLAGRLRAQRLDYAELVAEDPFRNANTPEDLELLRRAEAARNAG
jgi:molybdopterin-guanine dinucleotide biosynthesis protein A